nr:alpha/beta hydrolase [Allorhizobium sonneratiae]
MATADGARLAYHRQDAQTKAQGILILCHGLAEHAGRYQAFAEFMAALGFHVYAHDHRGHGQTRTKDTPQGRFALRSGVEKVVDDVKTMRDFALANHPDLPVILFGHSMGGLIALRTATTYPDRFQGLAIWNSNFNLGLSGRFARIVLSIERALKGSDVPSAILPRATFEAWGKAIPNHRTLFDWLSCDAAEVDRYIADPLCGFSASISLWLDVMEMATRTAIPDRLARLPRDLPIHLVGGGEDPATNKADATRWLGQTLKKAGLNDITMTIYPSMRHETLNEIGRDDAMADFARWTFHAVEADLIHSISA